MHMARRIEAFRGGFGGEILLPHDDGYDGARTIWNAMIARLTRIKRAYDPYNVFRVNQNIAPA